ncbi:TPA: hypothetical protein RFG09_001701 [Klebsiella aerogenes]|nr:hypothetical protein [Klebsiella aerogenes]
MKRISLTLLDPCFFKSISEKSSIANTLRNISPFFSEMKSSDDKDSILEKSTSGDFLLFLVKDIKIPARNSTTATNR